MRRKNTNSFFKLVGFAFLFIYGCYSSYGQESYFEYSNLPNLPANEGQKIQPGLAGSYIGVDDDVLIIAGGANFPNKLPWQGGSKKFYDEIFILERKVNETDEYEWTKANKKIPFSAAYGGAISTSKGLFCFGGNSVNSSINETWFINYIPETKEIEITPGPELPIPLSNFAFAKVDGSIYIAGGISQLGGEATNSFFKLETTNKPKDWEWTSFSPWEGKPRAFAIGVAQSDGLDNCFYLFSGRDIDKKGNWEILYDAHVYNPILNKWSVISKGGNKEFPFMAGTAFSLGANSIVFTSGAEGEMAKEEFKIKEKISQLEIDESNGEQVEQILKTTRLKLIKHLNNHPGFGNEISVFNTITKETDNLGSLPKSGQVTTTAVKWGEDIVIPSGEIRPGVRTPEILKVGVRKNNEHIGYLDIIVITIYFLILAWMGYYFSKRQKDIGDYFKGGGRIPWWAAGLSVFGTALSAITFMAIPAKTFATDWSYFMLNMTILIVAPIIVFWFIPFYRKLNITTAYEFLEARFNLTIRLLGSLSFIIFQIGRMGVVLFLPSIALSVVTGIDIFLCISLMGIVSLIYTIFGGIEAVIWTDVVQVIVLLGGAIFCLILMTADIEGGVLGIVEMARTNNKFNIIDLKWSLNQPTLWVMLLGGIFSNLITYGTDQTMVQRYVTTKTQKDAQKSVWTNAIITIPATLIFFFVGTTLFAFFKEYPSEMNTGLINNDGIFPWYIVSQLPNGVSGLLLAAIFAAAMSSLSSSMNSAATAYATDFHFRFNWNKKLNELMLARRATLILGIAGILFAFMMATMDIKSLWDEFQKVLGLVIGSLGGVFLLGIFTKKANSNGVLIGIVFSIIVQILVVYFASIHLLMYSATGVVSCFLMGYFASLFFHKKRDDFSN